MTFTIQYAEKVISEDIPRLSSSSKKHIKSAIERKLTEEPEKFGKPLRKSLKAYRSLRIGDYRVIFRIEELVVKIFAIGHRSTIYKHRQKRL